VQKGTRHSTYIISYSQARQKHGLLTKQAISNMLELLVIQPGLLKYLDDSDSAGMCKDGTLDFGVVDGRKGREIGAWRDKKRSIRCSSHSASVVW
jgi:hypothetical protein